MISSDNIYCIDWLKNNLSLSVSNLLGSGADGCVYELNNKVIKFSVLYNFNNNLNDINNIFKVLKYLSINKNNLYVSIYSYGVIANLFRDTVDGKQEYILYYYIMDKLNKLTEDEKKVFHSILSHEDRGINKNYSDEYIKNMLNGLSQGLDFDKKKVMLFVRKIKNSALQQTDIHPRNIMKDNKNNFLFIDIERTKLGEKYNE